MEKPRVIVVMGVAGSGKSTVGALLARRNDGRFFDADDFHPAANIAKMAAGIPLDDSDRTPWLARLRREVVDSTPTDGFSVLACSALKRIYRQQLGVAPPEVVLVYLKGGADLLESRLKGRHGHYMKPGMLASQLAILEEPSPEEGITVAIEKDPEAIAIAIEAALGLHFSDRPPK